MSRPLEPVEILHAEHNAHGDYEALVSVRLHFPGLGDYYEAVCFQCQKKGSCVLSEGGICIALCHNCLDEIERRR